MRTLIARFGYDPAVVFVLLNSAWNFGAGIVTLLVIASILSPEEQGYYFTFNSVIALKTFAELGFFLVIINTASHEWSKLELDPHGQIQGDADSLSRLVSLGRLVFKWYAAAALVFVVFAGVAGYVFFGLDTVSDVSWRWPWVLYVALSGLLLWTLPFVSLLEGCNQVRAVNRFRLFQSAFASIALWVTALLGFGLWVVVATAAVRLAVELYLLLVEYRAFFRSFLKAPTGPRLSWKKDIWGFQWRLALVAGTGYFATGLFNPVIFQYYGAAAAGQIGLTLSIINTLRSTAVAWMNAKAPRYGILVAKRRFRDLDRFFFRIMALSLSTTSFVGVAFLATVGGLYFLEFDLAQRLLPPAETAVFLFASLVVLVAQFMTVYFRAHKKEPLVGLGVIANLGIGFFVWLIGRQYGAMGAGAAYLLVNLLFLLPTRFLIWNYLRPDWQRAEVTP